MIFQHLTVIHFIDGITGGNHNVFLIAALEEGHILINGIRRAAEPCRACIAGIRREYEQAALLSAEVPPFGGT